MIGILKMVSDKPITTLEDRTGPQPDREIVIGNVPWELLGKIMMILKFDEQVNRYYYAGLRIYP